jgi:hypothetical protein
LQPEAAGESPFVPVSWYGVARPWALSGLAGTMISQLTFATGAGVVGVADGVAEGQGVAGAVLVGVADAVAVAVAVGVGVGVAVAVAEAVEAGVGVAVAAGVAAPVGGVAAAATGAAAATAGAGVPVAAGAAVPLAAGAGVAVVADAAVVGAVDVGVGQLLARFAALPEVPSEVLECETIRIPIPTPRTITMSPAIAARRARGRSWNSP